MQRIDGKEKHFNTHLSSRLPLFRAPDHIIENLLQAYSGEAVPEETLLMVVFFLRPEKKPEEINTQQ